MAAQKRTPRTLRLPPDLEERLEAAYQRTRTPKQRLIEMALEAYLPRLAARRPKRR